MQFFIVIETIGVRGQAEVHIRKREERRVVSNDEASSKTMHVLIDTGQNVFWNRILLLMVDRSGIRSKVEAVFKEVVIAGMVLGYYEGVDVGFKRASASK